MFERKKVLFLHTNKECNKCHLNSNVEKICSRPALNFKIHLCSITCTTVSEMHTHTLTSQHIRTYVRTYVQTSLKHTTYMHITVGKLNLESENKSKKKLQVQERNSHYISILRRSI